MNYKTIIIWVLLAGSIQKACAVDENDAPIVILNNLVSEHAVLAGSDELCDVIYNIGMFRKNLKRSHNVDMNLADQRAKELLEQLSSAVKAYQDNHRI